MSRIFSLVACLALATTLIAAEPKTPDAKKPDAKAPVAGNIAKPTADVNSWRFEQHEEAKGTMAVEEGAIAFDVTKEDGSDWHVQAFQTPLDLKNNTEYVVTFKAKAAEERSIKVQAGIDEEDWHNIGLDEEVTVGKEWKEHEFKFTANEVAANKNRVGFVLGGAKGKVWVKDLVIKPAK